MPPSPPPFTVHEAVEGAGFGPFQLLVGALCGFAWMADSMEIMLTAILPSAFACEWGIGVVEQAMGSTCLFLGMTVGSPLWGWMCDRYGRKTGLVVSSTLGCLLGCATAFSTSFTQFIVARSLVGASLGGVTQSTTLLTEFLPTAQRARGVLTLQVFFSAGGALGAILAYFVMPAWGWRALVLLSSIPLGIFALACTWLPESPRFYISKKNSDKAMEVLETVYRMNGKKLPKGDLIAEEASETRGNILALFHPKVLRTTLLVWVVWILAGFGLIGVILYTPAILRNTAQCTEANEALTSYHLNVTSSPTSESLTCVPMTSDDYLDLITTSFSEFPGLLLVFLIIDRQGRKFTMMLQAAVFAAASFVMAIPCLPRFAVVSLIFIARAVIVGLYQTSFIYTPEVYPTTLRATGLGIGAMVGRLGAMFSPTIAQILLSASPSLASSIYGCAGVAGAVAAAFLPIETSGRQLTGSL